MTPFYFGTRQHRLFGIYEPARQSGAHAAVLCYPFGAEYVSAHRSMRQLATLLSAAGYHVLRFDYYGTGDSAGEMTDATLCDWISDIKIAVDELRSMTNSNRITLIGLRLGATLAAMAVATLNEIDALVLWDPVVFGPDYLDELGVDNTVAEPAHAPRVGRSPVMDYGYQVGGFPLTFGMSREIATLDLIA
ncbi:MAG TPA: alpha/beta fold hydrolase, partial [Acetobacteraceae bacterium]